MNEDDDDYTGVSRRTFRKAAMSVSRDVKATFESLGRASLPVVRMTQGFISFLRLICRDSRVRA